MSPSLRFLAACGLSFLTALAVLAGINVMVDVKRVYHQGDAEAQQRVAAYVDQLQTAPIGLVTNGWSERAIKWELAARGGVECLVLGSSRAMDRAGR